MSKEEVAARLLILKAYKEWAALQRTELAEAGADWKPEHREVGEAGALKLGTVTRTRDTVQAEITDTDEALAWAVACHPEWIIVEPERVEVIPARVAIHPDRLSQLLRASEEAGQGLDPDSGEALEFITVRTVPGYLMTRLAPEVREQIRSD